MREPCIYGLDLAGNWIRSTFYFSMLKKFPDLWNIPIIIISKHFALHFSMHKAMRFHQKEK